MNIRIGLIRTIRGKLDSHADFVFLATFFFQRKKCANENLDDQQKDCLQKQNVILEYRYGLRKVKTNYWSNGESRSMRVSGAYNAARRYCATQFS